MADPAPSNAGNPSRPRTVRDGPAVRSRPAEGPRQARGDPRCRQATVRHAGVRRREHGPDRGRGRRLQAHRLQPLRRQGSPVRRRVQAHCEQQLPDRCSSGRRRAAARGLLQIARAFFAMISNPRRVAGHRIMCTPQVVDTRAPDVLGSRPPARHGRDGRRPATSRGRGRARDRRRPRAASQFLCLVKGELHARMVFGCDLDPPAHRWKPSSRRRSTCSCAPMHAGAPRPGAMAAMTSVLTSGTEFRVCYHSDAVPAGRKMAGFPREDPRR